jgi:hypothetical protein
VKRFVVVAVPLALAACSSASPHPAPAGDNGSSSVDDAVVLQLRDAPICSPGDQTACADFTIDADGAVVEKKGVRTCIDKGYAWTDCAH